MWLLTPHGFFSVVEKPGDAAHGSLTVRARVRSDLASLRAAVLPEMGPIEESESTDYRYRARVPRAAVAAAMARLVETLDYSNFKNAVADRQGSKRAKLYHDVWDVLYRMQSDPAYEAPGPQRPQSSRTAKGASAIPKADAYGGVLIDFNCRVLLREPKDHYGGYVWTFAKGRPDKGETPEQAALREVLEETGYNARIIAALPEPFTGDTTTTGFFLMEPVGSQGGYSNETRKTCWVTFAEASVLIAQTKTMKGRKRDQLVLMSAEKLLKGIRPW